VFQSRTTQGGTQGVKNKERKENETERERKQESNTRSRRSIRHSGEITFLSPTSKFLSGVIGQWHHTCVCVVLFWGAYHAVSLMRSPCKESWSPSQQRISACVYEYVYVYYTKVQILTLETLGVLPLTSDNCDPHVLRAKWMRAP